MDSPREEQCMGFGLLANDISMLGSASTSSGSSLGICGFGRWAIAGWKRQQEGHRESSSKLQ